MPFDVSAESTAVCFRQGQLSFLPMSNSSLDSLLEALPQPRSRSRSRGSRQPSLPSPESWKVAESDDGELDSLLGSQHRHSPSPLPTLVEPPKSPAASNKSSVASAASAASDHAPGSPVPVTGKVPAVWQHMTEKPKMVPFTEWWCDPLFIALQSERAALPTPQLPSC